MTNKLIRNQIKLCIYNFSSKKRQYEAWFVGKNIISSVDEDYCILFDDLMVEDYIDKKDNYMTEEENKELKKFINSLNRFSEYYEKKYNNSNSFDSEIVYNDLEWEKIRNQAKSLHELLEREEGVEYLQIVENWN